jgi:hypothetical protein
VSAACSGKGKGEEKQVLHEDALLCCITDTTVQFLSTACLKHVFSTPTDVEKHNWIFLYCADVVGSVQINLLASRTL